MPRLLAILGAIAIVLSGCGAQASPVGPGASATPPVVTPTSHATGASASVAPSASLPAPALPEGGDTVFPGTYTTHFQPALTLTVGREVELSCVHGYECRGDVDVNLPGWLGFEFGNAPAFELNVFRTDKVFDPKHPGTLIDPPADLAAWIAAYPGLTMVRPPAAVNVGGLDATQLDVRGGDKDVTFAPIPGVTDFPGFGVGPHTQQRLIVVVVDGHEVVIFVDAAKDSVGQFDAATWALQPLIDSIVWH